MIAACDIRYASQCAKFSIKEVDIGLAADLGTLQRLPKVVGNDSLLRELCYTGRNFGADEAGRMGMVSRICDDPTATLEKAQETAATIASKSPVAVVGTKRNLVCVGAADLLHAILSFSLACSHFCMYCPNLQLLSRSLSAARARTCS